MNQRLVKTIEARIGGYMVKDVSGDVQFFSDSPVYNVKDEEWHGNDITDFLKRYMESLIDGDMIYTFSLSLRLCEK